VLGVLGMQATEKQFFPSSNRAEILVEMWLPEGASLPPPSARPGGWRRSSPKDPDVDTYVGLRRQRLAALLPVARPAAVPAELRAVRDPDADVAGRDRAVVRCAKILDEEFPASARAPSARRSARRSPIRCSSA
jgi:hypothetical protein